MTKRRMSMPLNPHEDQLLKEHYLSVRIPIDQFEKRPEDFSDFVDAWNEMSGRHDGPGELLHYMRTKRKQKKWVTLDGLHQTAAPAEHLLSADERSVLLDIYREHVSEAGFGRDVLAYDSNVSDFLAKEFFHRTGRRLPPSMLIAVLTALGKRGWLPKMPDHPQRDEDMGFGDIDEVANE